MLPRISKLNILLSIAACAFIAAAFILEAQGAPFIDGDHDVADALRILQELDRYYSQAARPRLGRRDAPGGDQVDPQMLNRAVRLLQLQSLDRIYSYQTRPRYGKRADPITTWLKNIDRSPDSENWVSVARKR